MSIYFLKYDLFVAWTYNHEGFMVLDSCIGEYGGYFRNRYLYYTESEAIQSHVKLYHLIDLTLDEIYFEIKQKMEETA